MRISTLAALLLPLSPLVSAAVLGDRTGLQLITKTDDGIKIPGDSPLELCPGDHGNDQIVIDNVDLAPNPPLPGKSLDIVASGIIKETVEKGAYVLIQVKYGLIRLVSTKEDLCDAIGNVDLSCPLEPGKMTVQKTVELPSQIPPGRYTVFADVYNSDDTKITCLQATVFFPRAGQGRKFLPTLDL